MMSDDKSFAGSGAFVLDTMDEREREQFERQLAGSQELRNEVTELADTAALLGLAVEPVAPSLALKQNIMARLNQLPQLEPEATPVRTLHAVPMPVGAPSTRWYRRPMVALTAAAAAILLIVGGALGTNFAIQGAATSQQTAAIAAITTASDSQRAEVPASTGGTVTLVWSLDLRKSAVIGKGLKTLPAGKTYQLWYISTAGKATSAGLFEPSDRSVVQVLSGQLRSGDTVGVTVEPSGGSKAPTTKPIAAIASA
jgi:anti-sigma-K factor RskA